MRPSGNQPDVPCGPRGEKFAHPWYRLWLGVALGLDYGEGYSLRLGHGRGYGLEWLWGWTMGKAIA